MSMRNSKIMLKAVAFTLLLCLLLGLVSYFLEPPRTTSRVLMHEFYEQAQIDIAVVGASRFRRGIDPAVLDETLGGNTFMVSFGSQTPVDTYYILKELYKQHTPELVVLDMSYKSFSGEKLAPPSLFILPEFRFSSDKLLYMLNTVSPKDYPSVFFPVLSDANREILLLDSFNVLDNFEEKQSELYQNYDYSYASNSVSTYGGRGYLYSSESFAEGNVGNIVNATWKESSVDPSMLRFYEKTLEMCQKKGSQVVIIDMPLPFAGMTSQKGYAAYESYVRTFAKRYDVPFFNFGYLKTEVFDRSDSYFYDRKHLSQAGSQAFSPILAQALDEYMQGTLDEGKYFYASYEEMLDQNPRIFSTWLTYTEKTKTLTAHSYYGSGAVPEYQFLYKEKAKDDYRVVQEYGISDTLPSEEYSGGYIRVNCRVAGEKIGWAQYDVYTTAAKSKKTDTGS